MAPTYRVQLCLRPFTPREVQHRQQEVIDRLAAVAGDDRDPEVVWWSPRVCPPDGTTALAGGCPPVVVELIEFADREEISLAPYIDHHTGTHPGEDDSLVLPVICLVIRDGEAIRGLYPVTVGETRYTVEDGLGMLERGDEPNFA